MRDTKRRIAAVMLLFSMFFSSCGPDSQPADVQLKKDADASSQAWIEAETTPYGKYPELVTYTLGQMSGSNNSNLPQGDTYEDNAYTRYLREMLNIQNNTVYKETEDRYNEFVNIIVKDRKLPDILVISDRDILLELVENDLVEDLTEVYESCVTDRIKEMYDSYGEELLKTGTFDGKLMALPETVIDHGPCLLWLRKDWMDQLGLNEPKNWEDAIEILKAFQENRMGAEEGEEPLGLICDTALIGTTSSNYSIEPIFEMFRAYPQKWQLTDSGEAVYGSLTSETRSALAYLNTLYEKGILDPNFALRAQNNLRDLVVEGKCGAFFGLWWSPNNPLMEAISHNKGSDWEPYYLTQEYQGQDNTLATFRDNKYVVVRKGYEHPEIVMKIISVLFDYTRYEANDADEMNQYFRLNVNPTARPLVINVDYNEATYTMTKHIRDALDGTREKENLSLVERSYFDSCANYLENESWSAEDWASYKSRISAVGLLVDADYSPPSRRHLHDVSAQLPQSLQNLEKDTFLQIIMGRQPITYFDEFVEEWYKQGGEELTRLVQEDISN